MIFFHAYFVGNCAREYLFSCLTNVECNCHSRKFVFNMLLSWFLVEVLVFLKLENYVHCRPQVFVDFNPRNKSTGSQTGNKSRERILNIRRKDGINRHSDQDIVFPDSSDFVFEAIHKIDGPPKCASGKTFCEHFDPYPSYHIQEMLERNPIYDSFWGKDEVPVDITNRVAGDQETFVCSSIDRTIFPTVAKNKNSKWKYVINQQEGKFKQGIRIETCRNHGKPCDLIGELPNGYTTYCKQKYIYRRLLAVGEEGSPVVDSFEIPSACCCAYRRNDFLVRFGAPVTPAKKKKS